MGIDLTVLDVLPIMEARGARLVAGSNGTSRLVHYFDMIEHPDVKPWIRKGILFITTGYVFRNDKEALLELIHNLHLKEAAALAIKTRFFDDFPQEAIDYAEKLDFPLIFLDNSTSFIDITYPIMEVLMNTKNEKEDGQERNMLNNQLFFDLMIPRYDNWKEMEYRINALHWPLPPVYVAAIRIDSGHAEKLAAGEQMAQVRKMIHKQMCMKNLHAVVILKNNEWVCMFSELDEPLQCVEFFTEIKKRIEEWIKAVVHIGISMKIADYRNIPDAYTDVQDAISIGKSPKINQYVTDIETVRFEQVMMHMGKVSFSQRYVSDNLARLEQYDLDNNSNLLETLEALIRNMGRRKSAAAQLYLHRNTMAYRIKKIEQLTRADLSNGDDLMRLGFALRLKDYL